MNQVARIGLVSAVLLVPFAARVGAQCSGPSSLLSFSPVAVVPTTSSLASALEVADFDNDGNVDIVVSYSAGVLQFHAGNGDGSFSQAVVTSPAPGFQLADMAAGDFNEDGNMDVVTVQRPGWLSVMLGDGNGSFAGQAVSVSGILSSVTTGDLNLDGHIDVIVGQFSPGITTVFLGNGNGGLAASDTLQGGSSVVIADFDGDSLPDIATRVSDLTSSLYGVRVHYGNGAGGFPSNGFWSTAGSTFGAPFRLGVGDVDSDGHIDIVVVQHSFAGDRLSVFPNNGIGGFGPSVDRSIGVNPRSIELEDFNHDGWLDAAVNHRSDGGPGVGYGLTLLAGDGSMSFGLATTVGFSAEHIELARGDLNNDDSVDLASLTGSGRVFPFLNNCACAAAVSTVYGSGTPSTFGQPLLSTVALPVLGETGELFVHDPNPLSLIGVLVIGRTRANLPLFNGSLLVGSHMASLPFLLSPAGVRLRFAIPEMGCNELFTFQAIQIDLGVAGVATPLGYTMTRGVEWRLGR